MDAAIEKTDDATLMLIGVLSFETVVELKSAGEQHIAEMPDGCVIDLQKVSQAGSPAVSLLLAWLRFANDRDISLAFANLPADLLGVAQVSGLVDILPTQLSSN